MIRIFWWCAGIILVTSIFVGAAAAGSLAGAIAGSTGFTGGTIVGHIPTFVGSFKDGMATGPSGKNQRGQSGGTNGTSFFSPGTGVQPNWGGVNTAPAKQRGTAPASQR